MSLLLVGCGDDGDANENPPSADAIRDRTLDRYDSLDEARNRCEAVGNEADELVLSDEELVLLDAAPQCDLTRLGVPDVEGRIERQAIPAAGIAGEATFALCACSELEASNRVMAPGESDILGDLGANERIFGSAPIRVQGAVIAGQTARFDNAFEAAELRVNGVLTAANQVTVTGDAVVGGLDIPGVRVNVGGTLTVPEGTDLSSVESAGEVVYDSVTVAQPCDCSQDVDYDALRARFRDVDGDGSDDHDDEDFDIGGSYPYPPPPYLLRELDQDRSVHLACGRYYLDGIESAASLTLTAVGDVEVFVDGNVEVAGPFEIRVADGGSLALYVAGSLTPTNTVELGDPDEPDALRLYVRDGLRFAGPLALSGTVFAPRASLVADNSFDNRGAVFSANLDFAAPVMVADGPRFTRDACLVWDEADDGVLE